MNRQGGTNLRDKILVSWIFDFLRSHLSVSARNLPLPLCFYHSDDRRQVWRDPIEALAGRDSRGATFLGSRKPVAREACLPGSGVGAALRRWRHAWRCTRDKAPDNDTKKRRGTRPCRPGTERWRSPIRKIRSRGRRPRRDPSDLAKIRTGVRIALPIRT